MPLTAVVGLCLVSVGCNQTGLLYRNADWIIERYARKAVDASAAQIEQWRPRLVTALERHRREELPMVIGYLDTAAGLAGAPVARKTAACLVEGASLLLERHGRIAVDLSVPLLTALDSTQVEHLGLHLRERQREAQERYLDANGRSRQRARENRFIERTERWTGALTENQRLLTGKAVRRMPDLSPGWLAYRETQSQGLLVLLASSADDASVRQYLERWWVHWQGLPTADEVGWNTARSVFIGWLVDMSQSLTPRQRRTLEQRLMSQRDEFATAYGAKPLPARPLPESVDCSALAFSNRMLSSLDFSAIHLAAGPDGITLALAALRPSSAQL